MKGQQPNQQREPVQNQQPGREHEMRDKPIYIRDEYRGSGKLQGKVALITGGDSGIGRATAVHFAREGANVAFAYLCEDTDAEETRQLIENEGSQCLTERGDVSDLDFCKRMMDDIMQRFGKLDILVNSVAEQFPTENFENISQEQLEETFRNNVFGYFNTIKAALPHLTDGGRIINTTSITAHKGNPMLTDYSATKGAIESMSKSLASELAGRGITVNCVAPGPIWTPLIPSTFPKDKLEKFGGNTLMGRPGQPWEVASSYVFLASQDGSYFTGQTLHPNGGGLLAF